MVPHKMTATGDVCDHFAVGLTVLIKADDWMRLKKLSINYTKSMYFLTRKSIAEEEKRISKYTLIMLCCIGKRLKYFGVL